MSRIAKRVPIGATIVVVLAVLLMVRLGFWQLSRLHEKEALIARYSANATLPPVALPALFPVDDRALFRRVSADCLSPASWSIEGGGGIGGRSGWRHIALCRTGGEGPGIAVDVGVSQPSKPPAWGGGLVRGRLTWLPDHGSLLGRMLGQAPARVAMIVAETPAPGLAASAPPDPAGIPNNHLAYAVQWFLFAAVAAIIYGVALARRRQGLVAPPPGDR